MKQRRKRFVGENIYVVLSESGVSVETAEITEICKHVRGLVMLGKKCIEVDMKGAKCYRR